MKKLVSEIFAEFKKAKTKQAKQKLAEEYKTSKLFLQILQFTYHDKVKWLLPEGTPEYNQSNLPIGLSYLNLNESIMKKDMRVFIAGGGYDNLNQMKRERKFIELLENIYKDDAKILIGMKDKDLSSFGITKEQAHTFYPFLFSTTNTIL